ncbi:MAG: hypothetical protein ACOYXM_15780 [Actinomycetota bacterium]
MGLDAVGGALVTTDPRPDTRPGRLHQRLTVARAGDPEREALRSAVVATIVGVQELAEAAAGLAVERSAQRDAVRARLDAETARVSHDFDAAMARLERLKASEKDFMEGAAWAERVAAELPGHLAAVAEAGATLEARQLDQRAARASLDRVLEQRSAASAAMEDADRELGDLAGTSLDESGLRRELESAGQATREAHEAHTAAVARVQELMAERDQLDRRCADLREVLASCDAGELHADVDFDRVQAAFEAWATAAEDSGSDAYAQALADAFGDLHADMVELEGRLPHRPDPAEMRLAQEQVERTGAALEHFATASAQPPISSAERAELDAAHRAVEEAEERADRKVGRGSAQKRLERARADEAALLDRLGFTSYLEVVLGGGKRTASSPERLAAERDYIEAKAVRDALLRAQRSSPELEHLQSEERRLRSHAVERLGVDPGTAPIELLRAHPDVPPEVVHDLRDALASVGVSPVGVSLPESAAAWLQDQASLADAQRQSRASANDVAAELDDVSQRLAEVATQLAGARLAEERAAGQLESASRSVGAVEAELTVRAGEDDTRLKRFVAAEQLRTQVEALAQTLARAEQEARAMFVRATDAAAAAEVGFDRAQSAVDAIARKARKLAEELPRDQRPTGEPLATLLELAARLRAHAAHFRPTIEEATDVVALTKVRVDEAGAVAQAAGTGADGPRAEDLRDGATTLLERASGLIVLDEPFGGLDISLRDDLLEVVRNASSGRQIVFLTADPDVLGWAIGLPADVASVMSADSVLNLCRNEAEMNGTRPEDQSDPHPNTASPAHMWAGRR